MCSKQPKSHSYIYVNLTQYLKAFNHQIAMLLQYIHIAYTTCMCVLCVILSNPFLVLIICNFPQHSFSLPSGAINRWIPWTLSIPKFIYTACILFDFSAFLKNAISHIFLSQENRFNLKTPSLFSNRYLHTRYTL